MRKIERLDSAQYDALYGLKLEKDLKLRIMRLQRVKKIKMSAEIRRVVLALVSELESIG